LSWETEATNLDEFQSVARELSSSKASSLAATGQMIETEAIPVVEKYHKVSLKFLLYVYAHICYIMFFMVFQFLLQ
jgi:hypothetical protein